MHDQPDMIERPLRLLAWNIQHGGGPRRSPHIALALLEARPDIVVLTEFRGARGGQLAGVLHDHGLPHRLTSYAQPTRNAVCLCSRWPLLPAEDSALFADRPDLARRWLDARIPDLDLRVTGVHVPDAARADAHATAHKSLFWQRLNLSAAASTNENRVILGDFNTGRPALDEQGRTFTSAAHLGRLETLGFADAFRLLHALTREYTWHSPTGSGFRLDHAYVSPSLKERVRRCEYAHEHRESGLSDHASLSLELDHRSPVSRGKVALGGERPV
ncbi:MAG: endonuclease/exonuclease/phosphatase family protein [Phycisphaerales bacterium]